MKRKGEGGTENWESASEVEQFYLEFALELTVAALDGNDLFLDSRIAADAEIIRRSHVGQIYTGPEGFAELFRSIDADRYVLQGVDPFNVPPPPPGVCPDRSLEIEFFSASFDNRSRVRFDFEGMQLVRAESSNYAITSGSLTRH